MTQRVNDAEQKLWKDAAALDFLKGKYGWSFDTIVEARLGLEGDRILFPTKDLAGEWHYTTRQYLGEGPKYKHDLPVTNLFLPKLPDRPVVLCEGHSDTITAMSMGLNAMGLMGTSTVGGVLEDLKKYPEVTVLMDADPAGWKATRALVTGLLDSNTRVNVAFLMPKNSPGLRLAMPEPFGAWYSGLGLDLTEYHKDGMGTPSVIEGPVLLKLKNPPPPPPRLMGPGRTDIDVGKILSALTCGNRCPCSFAARRGYGAVHCPAHADPTPSFSVKELDGRVLVHCFAGCDQPAVIDALRERGLWPKRESNSSTFSPRRGAGDYRSHSGFRGKGIPTSGIYPSRGFLRTGEPRSVRGGSGSVVTRGQA